MDRSCSTYKTGTLAIITITTIIIIIIEGLDKWINGWMNKWMDGIMNGWTDGCICLQRALTYLKTGGPFDGLFNF